MEFCKNISDESIDVTSATPQKDASVHVYENAEYWIEAKIKSDDKTYDAFDVIQVDSVTGKTKGLEFGIPERQVAIIAIVVIIVGIVGLMIQRKTS